MRGSIECVSVFGEGTCFRGFITVESVEAEESKDSVSPLLSDGLALGYGPPLRILCCEGELFYRWSCFAGETRVLTCSIWLDNHISRSILFRQLTKFGHTVDLAEGKS